jgi:hypothetical protein
MWVLNIPVDRQNNAVTKRLADVMRSLGWTKPEQTIRIGGNPCRGYTKTIETKAITVVKPRLIPSSGVPNLIRRRLV